ncbi:two-component system response regulator [Schlegelella sp. S2-27]|uniref:Two-component system response regulator n=1 Tax=Caldimonas mangrovi TaxID=2944811 RepID=A0ABT0YHV8_9BURK|nr:two-component system response regulator [Caldimonas mangrovi]MCM5677974.1 two-component system response regulator [Caldimonas mangrovi]
MAAQADQLTITKPTVLVVDDTPENLSLMSRLLKESYRVLVANSGERGLRIALGETPPDLILLDIMMPGMDGYEVLSHLKGDPRTQTIPVIFLTAMSQEEDEEKGLNLGAVDYITKPISPPLVLARVATHLHLKTVADFLRDKNAFLEAEVGRRTRELQAIQDVTVVALASLAETRDNETGNHVRRTQFYVRSLCQALRTHAKFERALTDKTIEALFKSAPLHDIGKVGVPDHILLKPGKLTAEEFDIMKRHPVIGRDALQRAEEQLGVEVEFLHFAKEIAYGHHEKWDGSGYPQGLKGDEIPLSARLMALADVYDALISRRVYKPPMSHDEAVALILASSGSHFDPDVVAAFTRQEDDFRAIAERYADDDEDLAVVLNRMAESATTEKISVQSG